MNIKKIAIEENKARTKLEKVEELRDKIIQNAKIKAERILREDKIEEQVEKRVEEKRKEIKAKTKEIQEKYKQSVEKIKEIPESKIEEAAEMVIKRVLTFE